MSWIFLAVIAQFINAGVAIVDKYVVSGEKSIFRPFVYAFYTSLLAGMWLIVYVIGFIPISFYGLSLPSFSNVEVPTLQVSAYALIASYTFFIALVSMFKALRHGNASEVVPVIGSVSAVTTFGLSILFLGATVTSNFIYGIFLLALGTALVSHFRFPWQTAMTAIHAGIFFAIHFIAIKGLFNEASFDNGFFWSRIAFVVVALSMLLIPRYCVKIFEQTKESKSHHGLLILVSKLFAGIATILILKATELGDVSVVQALGGLQFVFILLFSLFLGRYTPDKCGENHTCDSDIYHKVIFVSIITLGFVMLFV